MNQPAIANTDTKLPEITTTGDIMLNEATMNHLTRMAAQMAGSTITVPEHLRGKEGDCLAIIMQAVQWGMNPFVVAQKTHLVQGKLGYEAQLVNAVVQASGMIDGSFSYEYQGEGEDLECRVGAVLKGQGEITWGEWLRLKDVTVRNSPLYKTNPKQQMGYLQVKNWTRLYCPGAILGVYTVDELRDAPNMEREVGPGAATSSLNDLVRPNTKQHPDELAEDAEVIEREAEDAVTEPVGEEEPAPEPEGLAPDRVTFAEVAESINKASTLEALSAVGNMVIPGFLEVGDNAQYKQELTDLYKARQTELKAIADEQKQ